MTHLNPNAQNFPLGVLDAKGGQKATARGVDPARGFKLGL